MAITLRRGFLAFLLLAIAFLIGRVFLSFAFVAGSIGHTLGTGPGATSIGGLITGLTDVSSHLSRGLAPGVPLRSRSVLDVPAEIEARQKAGGVILRQGGPLILTVGD